MSQPYFISYNRKDRASVIPIHRMLEAAGIRTWLDERDIPLGDPWSPHVFTQGDSLAGLLVFLGTHGLGPGQENEVNHYLKAFAPTEKPVIPILLPGFHEEKPDLPDFCMTELVSKFQHIDLALMPLAALRRLAERLNPKADISPSDLERTVAEIPRAVAHPSADKSFLLSWAGLHVVGYLAIAAVVQYISHLRHPRTAAAVATTVVMSLLLYAGRRIVRNRSIQPDIEGALVGVAVAVLGSFLLVSQASSPDGLVRAIGALATTIAAGGLAGAIAGWLAGLATAALASAASSIAAALVPTDPIRLQDSTQGIPIETIVGLFGGAVGAGVWGSLLALLLLSLAREHIRYRSWSRLRSWR